MNEYHWYRLPEQGPPAIRHPSELGSSSRLRIACTQTGLPVKQQRSLVKEWCEVFPTLGQVTELRFLSKVPQELFDSACQIPNLRDLYVKFSGIRNIDSLSQTHALEFLHIGSSPSIASIEPLKGLRALKWLGLENLSSISEIDVVGGLKDLEGLTLEGSMYKTWTVASLSPLASLTELKYVSLANLRSKDCTLSPLLQLRKLRIFRSGTWWDAAELAALRLNTTA